MKLNSLHFEVDQTLGVLRLVSSERRNAITAEMRAEFAQVIDAVTAGEDGRSLPIRALLVAADGDCFCAGGDLKDMNRTRTAPMVRHRVINAHHWFSRFVNLEMPMIAAVNGPAIGAGFSLALAADIVIASPRATFTCAFARMGLVPDLSLLSILPRIIGLQRAKELVLSAGVLTAHEAKQLGIVYAIFPESEVEEAARAIAMKFSKAPPEAIGLSKVILNRSFSTDHGAMVELEAMAQGIAASGKGHRAAVEAFLAKQPLEFAGVDKRADPGTGGTYVRA